MLPPLAALLGLLFTASTCQSQPGHLPDIVENVVWRADSQPPETLRAAGGIWPRARSVVNDTSAPNRVLNPPLLMSTGLSLFYHVAGNPGAAASRGDSAYVSTTVEYARAQDWLWRSGRVPGYVYAVRTTPNFIDVALTLGGYYLYPCEREVAALGGIHFAQILGWRHVIPDPRDPARVLVGPYTPNRYYNARVFDGMRGGGAQYQLAGFPDGHDALQQSPWATHLARCLDPNDNGLGKRCLLQCGPGGSGSDGDLGNGVDAAIDPLATAEAAAANYMGSVVMVDRLSIYFQISYAFYSGTDDSISIKIGDSVPVHLMSQSQSGQARTVRVDVSRIFGRPQVPLSALSSVTLIQTPSPHPLMSDDFQPRLIFFEAHSSSFNGTLKCTKFEPLNTWYNTERSSPAHHRVGAISVSDWNWSLELAEVQDGADDGNDDVDYVPTADDGLATSVDMSDVGDDEAERCAR